MLVRSLCLSLLLLSLNGTILGQINNQFGTVSFNLKSMMPTSPDAATLGKFGDIPVGYYTGTTGISIPVYTIEDKEAGFSMPIVLRYSGSGIKVADQAGIAGLGWELQAEGSIIQIVNGKEDALDQMLGQDPTGYLAMYSGSVLGSYSERPTTNSNVVPCQPNNGGDDHLDTYNSVLAGDGQPDIYQYNFCGHSGKFYINPYLQKITLLDPKEPIVFTNTGNYTWTAKTMDGNIYTFALVEKTQVVAGNYAGYTSKLTQIQLNDGKYITLHYTPGYFSSYNYSENYHDIFPFSLNPSAQYGTVPSLYYTNNYVYYLNNITTNDVSINFNLEARGDLGGIDPLGTGEHPSRLKSIDILDENANRLTKTFSLFYSYFPYDTVGSNLGSNAPSLPSRDTVGKRLRLDSVLEKGYALDGSTISKPPYKFGYDTSHIMPLKTSFAQDYWGYFNGIDNRHLIPDLSFLHYGMFPGYETIPDATIQWLNGGNTAPDKSLMTAYMLNKVTYPTGGYTQFTYEPNSFTNQIYPDQSKLADSYHQGFISDNNVSSDRTTSENITPTRTFVIKLTNLIARGNNTSVTLNQLQPSTIQLIKVKNGTLTTLNNWQMTLVSPYTDSFSVGSNYRYSWVTSVTVPYDSGSYYYVTTSLPDALGPQETGSNNATVSCAYSYYTVPDSDWKVSYGGGVRVSSITNFDMNGNQVGKKILRYVNTDSTSSGLLMSPLSFVDRRGMVFVENTTISQQTQFLMATDSINYVTTQGYVPYSTSATGNLVGYSRVEEIDVAPDGSTNGRHVYYYHNQPSKYFIGCPDDPDLLNGSQIKDQIFDAAGDSIKVTNYTYIDNYSEHDSTPPVYNGVIITPNYFGADPCSFGIGGGPDYTALVLYAWVKYYPLNTYWYVPQSKTTNYYANGNVLSSTETYKYNMSGQLIETDSRNSKNEPTAKQIIHVTDTTSSGATLLTTAGMLDKVLSEKNWVGSSLMSEQDIYYGTYDNQYVIDSTVQTFNGAAPVTDYRFTSYGPYRTLDQFDHRGSVSSIIWDYETKLIIANIENAGVADVAYTSFEAGGSGNWQIPDTTRIRTAGLTGSKAYRLNASNSITSTGYNTANTYIVSYWEDSSANTIKVNGTAGTAKVTFGNWTYYEAQVTGITSVTVSGNGIVDELRLYPKGALMTTYTYLPLIGITSQCDPSSKIIYYTYDGIGRLKLVSDQYGNILKRYDYQYQAANQ